MDLSLIWLWLLIGDRILSSLTPFTSKFGAIVNTIAMIAEMVFCVLCFFFAPVWWYGLVAAAIYFCVPALVPKINPSNLSKLYINISGTVSFLHPVLVALMYLSLFNVL